MGPDATAVSEVVSWAQWEPVSGRKAPVRSDGKMCAEPESDCLCSLHCFLPIKMR